MNLRIQRRAMPDQPSNYKRAPYLIFLWPCIMNWLYINYQLLCTDYYLFIKYYSPLHVSSLKCSSSGGYSCTHAAYGTVTVPGGLSVHSLSENCRNSHREWQYHMLHVYNCILLKMSTWGSKHVEENSILWLTFWSLMTYIYIYIYIYIYVVPQR